MKLSVPTNWQPDLLDNLNKSRVKEIYGKLDSDPIGGCRPTIMLPYIDKRRVKDYILNVHQYGLKFNYLLNATCLGNVEWSVSGQKRIRKFLDWLSIIGVDAVTITIPYMLQIIKKHYPYFKTKVSVSAQVSDSLQAKYWEDLGADEIVLAPWLANRNFRILREIRQAVRCRLEILANSYCLFGCPFAQHHYASDSHASRNALRTKNEISSMNYWKFTCYYLMLEEPMRLISASWVRPEDIHYYAEAGIDSIKLRDRSFTSEQIYRIIDAYTFEKYEGNLLDLFKSDSKRSEFRKGITWKELKSFLKLRNISFIGYCRLIKDLFSIKAPRGVKLSGQMPVNDLFFLDNAKLNGFLDFFIEGKCGRINCDKCGYCRKVADKALYLPGDYRIKSLRIYEKLLGEVLGKDTFSTKNLILEYSHSRIRSGYNV